MYKTCLALWIAVIAASGPVRAQYGLGTPVKPTTAEPPMTLPNYLPPPPTVLPNYIPPTPMVIPNGSSSKPVLQAPVIGLPAQPAPANPDFPTLPFDGGPYPPCLFHFSPSYPEPVGFGSHGMLLPGCFASNYPEPAGTSHGMPWLHPNRHCPPTYPEPISYALGMAPGRLPHRTPSYPQLGGTKPCEPERKSRCWPLCWSGWSKFVPTFSVAAPAAAPAPTVVPEPLPTREDIARMMADGNYSLAEIAAVKIKLDESQAKGRQAAVQYLATIDCHFYPEAENGLIAALRADRIESVRFEAAQAMGNCRCMTARMIDAVRMSAMGMDTDGNPGETSDRVRQAAREALNRCPQCQGGPAPADPTNPMPQWLPSGPMSIQPTNHWLPPHLPFTQEEREVAATVSTLSRSSSKANPDPPRPVVQWLSDLASGRLLRPASAPTGAVDPRLQGLRPLGSDVQLAIPGATSYNK